MNHYVKEYLTQTAKHRDSIYFLCILKQDICFYFLNYGNTNKSKVRAMWEYFLIGESSVKTDCVLFSGGGVRHIPGCYNKDGCSLVDLTIHMISSSCSLCKI